MFSHDLLVGSEIIFQVNASADDSRTTLYKFIKFLLTYFDAPFTFCISLPLNPSLESREVLYT